MSHVHVNMEDSLCGRQPLKNLISPLLHTLSHMCLQRNVLAPTKKNGPPESKSPPSTQPSKP